MGGVLHGKDTDMEIEGNRLHQIYHQSLRIEWNISMPWRNLVGRIPSWRAETTRFCCPHTFGQLCTVLRKAIAMLR